MKNSRSDIGEEAGQEMKSWGTIEELAEDMAVSVRTAYRWLDSGRVSFPI